MVDDPRAVEALQRDLDARKLEISALSCHGNPLHPNPDYAERAGTVFRSTVLAAEKLGVRQVVLFAGCPGTPDGGEYPNWVSTGWPGYFEELLEWQWEEKIIPFWTAGRGVRRRAQAYGWRSSHTRATASSTAPRCAAFGTPAARTWA